MLTSEPSVKPRRLGVGRLGAGRLVGRGNRRRTLLVVLILAIVIFGVVTAVVFVWPNLPQLPPRADAIIELGGPGDSARDSDALALARAHRAPILIQSTEVGDAVSDGCLPPVPGVTILCFHADPNTTRGEAQYIGQMARREHWKSVILVTTPDQAWRARLRVSRCFAGQVYVSTAPLPPLMWFRQIPYQWSATVKALVYQRDC